MKIKFIEWIECQNIPNDVKDLFREASICFKNDAYRASLLLSYLGFQSIIKDRLIKAAKPNDFNEKEWEHIIHEIKDEDNWDKEVYDALMRRKKEIFSLKDDIKNQITYWKNRRNDCAHYKDTNIDSSHIESFWLFIRTNFSKIVVNGSIADLLNKIEKHYDYTQTPPDRDISYIVNEIPNAVDDDDYEHFLKESFKIIRVLHEDLLPGIYSDELIGFFTSLFRVNDTEFKKALTEFIKKDSELLEDVLFKDPNIVASFGDDPNLIRKIWYETICDSYGSTFPVYCSLIGQGLIPEEQIEESIHRIIKSKKIGIPKDAQIKTLEQVDFFKYFYKVVFKEDRISNFKWSNSNKDFIVFFLQYFDLDSTILKSICNNFSKKHHPFDLAISLNSFFEKNEDKLRSAVSIIIENDLNKPTYLEPLIQEIETKGTK